MKSFVSTQTIRGKLLLWFVSTITAVFFLLGGLVSLIMWQVLHDQIDHHLHSVITEAKYIIGNYDTYEQEIRLKSYAQQKGMTISLISGQGEPLLQTNSPDLAALSLPVMKELLNKTPINTNLPSHFTVQDMRFATLPVPIGSSSGLLAAGYSLMVIETTFQKLFGLIALMLLVALALVVYGIRNLLSRYLHPVEVIAKEANTIAGSKYLHHRISTNQETLELQSLAIAINSMLERLERFFITEHHFFSDAAHALKTPLAVARSFIESNPESKQQQACLKTLDTANDTIQDLILISRMNSEETIGTEKFSLSDLLENLAQIADVLTKDRNIAVSTRIETNIEIKANKQLMKKALSNLIQNAINYTRNHGKISITLIRKKRLAIIQIIDTGIGISKTDYQRVFERFYRGGNVRSIRGSGLGLSIVKAIIEASGGEINLYSKLNHGTKVEISFLTT